MEIVHLKITDVERNEGQVKDLPSNPRQWTKSGIKKIAKSLVETPSLFEARPLLCYPLPSGHYVTLYKEKIENQYKGDALHLTKEQEVELKTLNKHGNK